MRASPSGELPRRGFAADADVWAISLDLEHEPGEAAVSLLAQDEEARMRRYRRPADARRFAGARAALRLVLGAYLGRLPSDLTFDTTCRFCGGSHGKPRVQCGELEFSASRSGAVAVIAVSPSAVGVDVESVPVAANADELSQAVLSSAEQATVRRLPGDRRRDAVVECWVRKEAVLKAAGRGLAVDPRTLSVTVDDSAGTPRITATPSAHPELGGWMLADLGASLPTGYMGALALRVPSPRVAVFCVTTGSDPESLLGALSSDPHARGLAA